MEAPLTVSVILLSLAFLFAISNWSSAKKNYHRQQKANDRLLQENKDRIETAGKLQAENMNLKNSNNQLKEFKRKTILSLRKIIDEAAVSVIKNGEVRK